MDINEIRVDIEDLIISSSDDSISTDDLKNANGSLENVGYTSLNYMTVLVGLEQKFGITIDPYEEPSFLESVNTITDYVCDQLGIK
jgi:acyl carrier protein